MEDKKRMAGSYEIIQAFHIGDREIVLGEDITPSRKNVICVLTANRAKSRRSTMRS